MRQRLLRSLAAALLDVAIVAATYVAALLFRFDGHVPTQSWHAFARVYPGIALAFILANWLLGIYRIAWRYASVIEAVRLGAAVMVATIVVTGINVLPRTRDIPLSVTLVSGPLSFLAMSFVKLSPRLLAHRPTLRDVDGVQRVLIAGAGATGQFVAREFQQHRVWRLRPVGFVDDDTGKRGSRIHGVPVLGAIADLPRIARRVEADLVAIALPSVSGAKVREIAALAEAANVPVRMVPGLPEVVRDNLSVGQLRELTVEDLLGREPVEIDFAGCAAVVHNASVLITGAAGSVGTELARQALALGPAALHLLDINESGLHDLQVELAPARGECDIKLWIGSVAERAKTAQVFSQARPDLVFHAGAYKHVDLMELHPDEAFRANVVGTLNVCQAADLYGARKLVFISTDKSVHPASVYGATKRVGELLVQAMAERSETVFCTVRFGNVIGSRGSVVPTFWRQIASGGPVTLTHPEMMRYFLTIPEAVSLVIQAAAFARQGQTFMLDMGEEVRIADLAERMIRLKGLRPGEDIPIVYTGLRPGEKLREVLVADHEEVRPTSHPKVLLMATERAADARVLVAEVERLARMQHDPARLARALHALARLEPGAGGEPEPRAGARVDRREGDAAV